AHLTLTAYGLREFNAMAKVHDVDPNLIARTRKFLLDRRHEDGTWQPEQRQLHDNVTGNDPKTARLGTTAYVAWAVLRDGKQPPAARGTAGSLLSHSPRQIVSDHILALVCNALLASDPSGKDVGEYLDELLRRRKQSDNGRLAWWEPPAGDRLTFGSGGET